MKDTPKDKAARLTWLLHNLDTRPLDPEGTRVKGRGVLIKELITVHGEEVLMRQALADRYNATPRCQLVDLAVELMKDQGDLGEVTMALWHVREHAQEVPPGLESLLRRVVGERAHTIKLYHLLQEAKRRDVPYDKLEVMWVLMQEGVSSVDAAEASLRV